jgi:hypothetical protein
LKKKKIDEIELKFYELAKKEKMMQKCYESLIHKEKEKAENELFEKLEPVYDENGNLLSNEEAFRLSDEFKDIQE